MAVQGGAIGLRISRDTYATINKRSSMPRWAREMMPELWDAVDENYEDPDHRIYTDRWCANQRARALGNYDLNMAFFASLDHAEFDQAIAEAVTTWDMVDVTDLKGLEQGLLHG